MAAGWPANVITSFVETFFRMLWAQKSHKGIGEGGDRVGAKVITTYHYRHHFGCHQGMGRGRGVTGWR